MTFTGIYESLRNVNRSLLTDKEAFDEFLIADTESMWTRDYGPHICLYGINVTVTSDVRGLSVMNFNH